VGKELNARVGLAAVRLKGQGQFAVVGEGGGPARRTVLCRAAGGGSLR